jgi:hypothetical protein
MSSSESLSLINDYSALVESDDVTLTTESKTEMADIFIDAIDSWTQKAELSESELTLGLESISSATTMAVTTT